MNFPIRKEKITPLDFPGIALKISHNTSRLLNQEYSRCNIPWFNIRSKICLSFSGCDSGRLQSC